MKTKRFRLQHSDPCKEGDRYFSSFKTCVSHCGRVLKEWGAIEARAQVWSKNKWTTYAVCRNGVWTPAPGLEQDLSKLRTQQKQLAVRIAGLEEILNWKPDTTE